MEFLSWLEEPECLVRGGPPSCFLEFRNSAMGLPVSKAMQQFDFHERLTGT